MYVYIYVCIYCTYMYHDAVLVHKYICVCICTFCMYSVSKFYVEVGATTVCCLALQGMLNFVRLQRPSSPTTAVLYGVFVILIVSCCHSPACVWTYCTYVRMCYQATPQSCCRVMVMMQFLHEAPSLLRSVHQVAHSMKPSPRLLVPATSQV